VSRFYFLPSAIDVSDGYRPCARQLRELWLRYVLQKSAHMAVLLLWLTLPAIAEFPHLSATDGGKYLYFSLRRPVQVNPACWGLAWWRRWKSCWTRCVSMTAGSRVPALSRHRKPRRRPPPPGRVSPRPCLPSKPPANPFRPSWSGFTRSQPRPSTLVSVSRLTAVAEDLAAPPRACSPCNSCWSMNPGVRPRFTISPAST
jgi:hypothetical protein